MTRIRKVFGAVFVLWVGSLWSLALWVAPTLFAQSDRHLAGVLAARLFGIETYLGVAVAGLALALPDRSLRIDRCSRHECPAPKRCRCRCLMRR